MDGDEDASNGALCKSRGHLEAFDLPLHLGHTAFLRGASDNFCALSFLDFVLHDVLIHDAVVELIWIFQSVVVVYLAVFRLNHVSLRWIDYICD